jgi:hypothetical protein
MGRVVVAILLVALVAAASRVLAENTWMNAVVAKWYDLKPGQTIPITYFSSDFGVRRSGSIVCNRPGESMDFRLTFRHQWGQTVLEYRGPGPQPVLSGTGSGGAQFAACYKYKGDSKYNSVGKDSWVSTSNSWKEYHYDYYPVDYYEIHAPESGGQGFSGTLTNPNQEKSQSAKVWVGNLAYEDGPGYCGGGGGGGGGSSRISTLKVEAETTEGEPLSVPINWSVARILKYEEPRGTSKTPFTLSRYQARVYNLTAPTRFCDTTGCLAFDRWIVNPSSPPVVIKDRKGSFISILVPAGYTVTATAIYEGKRLGLSARAPTALEASVPITVNGTQVQVPLNGYRLRRFLPNASQVSLATPPAINASTSGSIREYGRGSILTLRVAIPPSGTWFPERPKGTLSGYHRVTVPVKYCIGLIPSTCDLTLIVTLTTSRGRVLYNETFHQRSRNTVCFSTTIKFEDLKLEDEYLILTTKHIAVDLWGRYASVYGELRASYSISSQLVFDRWEIVDLATEETTTYKTPSVTVSLGSKGVNATAWYVPAQLNGSLKIIPLSPGAMYLPGEGIATPWLADVSNWAWNGTWWLNVTEPYPVSEHLVAILMNSNGGVEVLPLPNGTSLGIQLPERWRQSPPVIERGGMKIVRLNLREALPTVKVDGRELYFVALAAWDPYKQGYDTSCWLSNGTTLAVYSLTFTYTLQNGTRIVFKETVVVSTLKVTAAPVYSIGDLKQGLSLKVTASWKYLPPAASGVQPSPPSSIVGVAVIGNRVYEGTLIKANATSKTFLVRIADDTWTLYGQGVASITASAYWLSSMGTPEGPVALQEEARLSVVYVMPHIDAISEGASLTATISVLDVKTGEPVSADVYIELRDNRTYAIVATYGPYRVPGQVTINMPGTKQYVLAIYAVPAHDPRSGKLVVPIAAVYPPRA